jgi:hypothetical protein
MMRSPASFSLSFFLDIVQLSRHQLDFFFELLFPALTFGAFSLCFVTAAVTNEMRGYEGMREGVCECVFGAS